MPKKYANTERHTPTSRKRGKKKMIASIDQDAAIEGGLGSLSIDRVETYLSRSKNARVFVQRLELVGRERVKPLRQQIHKARREQLAEAYAAIAAFRCLDKPKRAAVIEELKLQEPSTNRKSDPTHIILRSVFEYAGHKADRSVLCRDAQAIKYALGQKIEVAEFVERLSAKGASIRRWADLYAAAHRSSSNDTHDGGTMPSIERSEVGATLADAFDLRISRRRLSRRGLYLMVIKRRKERVEIQHCAYLARSLNDEVIERVVAASITAAPIVEQG